VLIEHSQKVRDKKEEKRESIELTEEVHNALVKFNGRSKKKGRALSMLAKKATQQEEKTRKRRKIYEPLDLSKSFPNPFVQGTKRAKKRETNPEKHSFFQHLKPHEELEGEVGM